MNGILFINDKPVVLLSENTIDLIHKKILKYTEQKDINIKSINDFLKDLEMLTYTPESFRLEITDYFTKENIPELEILIQLYTQAVKEINEEKDFHEFEVSLSLIDELVNYLNELKKL